MLTYLKIDNFVLIARAELEFHSNFNVITGESGAGKSILIAAAALLLGGRTEHTMIRNGCRQAEVAGIFHVPAALRTQIDADLAAAGIEPEADGSELALRRTITLSGTRNFINDVPVSAKLMAGIVKQLVDLHGVNEHLSLTGNARQLELLDNYLKLFPLRQKCAERYRQWQELRKAKADFLASLPDENALRQLQLLLEDVDAVSPRPDEEEELNSRHRIAANRQAVLEAVERLTQLLDAGNEPITDQLGVIYQQLSGLAKIDDHTFSPLLRDCGELQDGVAQLSRRISSVADAIDIDSDELSRIEERLAAIYKLKRRYAPSLAQVLELREQAWERIQAKQQAEQHCRELESQEQQAYEELLAAARELSAARRSGADKFTAAVAAKLKKIGFNHAVLTPQFTECDLSERGCDQLELIFSANAGEEPRPLRKIASSGELSRLMLALKTVLADADAIPTVIFDEIDMNIGGEAANQVGRELAQLGKKHQILCISHLAPVAALADAHFKVVKRERDGRTFSEVERLDDPIPELARMLGNGPAALLHAASIRASKSAEQ